MQLCDMHYNESCVSLVEPPHEGIPTRPELRRLLDALLPGDSDLNGFVYDHYPAVLAHYHPGLLRVAKLDLLLEHAEPGELVRRLRERGLHGRKRRASEVFNWSSERKRHAEVFGRQPVLDVLAQAIERGGWVVVSGRAGVGKTALLVQLLNGLESLRGRPVPHRPCVTARRTRRDRAWCCGRCRRRSRRCFPPGRHRRAARAALGAAAVAGVAPGPRRRRGSGADRRRGSTRPRVRDARIRCPASCRPSCRRA